ncbi:MAG: rhomboid family intramembrane serine protease [Planctomycetota bacterium]
MLPFRDYNRSGSTPYVTIVLIALNVLVFLVEQGQRPQRPQYSRRGEPQIPRMIAEYSMQPAEVVRALQGKPVPGQSFPALLTPLTSMFMHGGWLHLLGNMLYLWIFGDNIEDRMGHPKFLGFYVLCGLGASAAHTVFNLSSMVPTVGASGAIAGVLGAYLIAFPHARVDTLVPIGFFLTVIQLPAVVVLGLWFLIQFLSGLGSLGMRNVGGVAWWAHIGGFVLGIGLLFVFQKPKDKRRAYSFHRR